LLPRIVLVDANVFFAPRLRDQVMHLHAAELINLHWTKDIEAEWTRNVVAKQGADPADIQACLRGMRAAVDGWEDEPRLRRAGGGIGRTLVGRVSAGRGGRQALLRVGAEAQARAAPQAAAQ